MPQEKPEPKRLPQASVHRTNSEVKPLLNELRRYVRPGVTHDQVRNTLKRLNGSLSEDILAERGER